MPSTTRLHAAHMAVLPTAETSVQFKSVVYSRIRRPVCTCFCTSSGSPTRKVACSDSTQQVKAPPVAADWCVVTRRNACVQLVGAMMHQEMVHPQGQVVAWCRQRQRSPCGGELLLYAVCYHALLQAWHSKHGSPVSVGVQAPDKGVGDSPPVQVDIAIVTQDLLPSTARTGPCKDVGQNCPPAEAVGWT
jgi:hypothetical protein